MIVTFELTACTPGSALAQHSATSRGRLLFLFMINYLVHILSSVLLCFHFVLSVCSMHILFVVMHPVYWFLWCIESVVELVYMFIGLFFCSDLFLLFFNAAYMLFGVPDLVLHCEIVSVKMSEVTAAVCCRGRRGQQQDDRPDVGRHGP